MSTIGALLMPKFEPPDLGRAMNQGILGGANIIQGQTNLLALQDLKRQQEAQAQARALYQQDPSLLLSGGSVLGSLGQAPDAAPPGAITQQPFGPGGATGPTQQISSPMAPNANLGGPPGGTGQSTIASLGPQAPPQQTMQERLMALARTNPDAALLVQQQMQQQQDLALKREEQRLTMGTRVAEYVGRVAQGVTSPETLEQARQELARIHPQAAAQLPQAYSKDAMLPFVKKAVSVKDNALLQLETWKNQIEEQKLGVQLANAGYQGLGTDVTSILRGLTPEQVTEFGGRTSAKAIAYATEEEKKRKLVQAGETERQRGQTERELRGEKTVSEAFGTKSKDLFDTQTGRPIDALIPVKELEARPKGAVAELSDDNRKQMENINSAMPRLEILYQHIDKVYGPGGVLARMSPEERSIIMSGANITERWINQFEQKYPELNAAQKYIDANSESLARALSGVKGAATEGDVERAKAMLPNLTTALNVWPPSKIGVTLPDTQATALRTMNNLTDTLNGIGSAILGNKEYRTPLKRYETLTQTPGQQAFPPTTTPQGQAAPAPAPTQPPAAGPPLFPRPAIREPGAPAPALPTAPTARPTSQVAPAPAPGTRPAPPTARSTPAQDEAYRQSVAPPPAPSAPATKPTPGRQSQAPAGTRMAGAPKYMNLADVREAMIQTGRSRTEVEKAARARGFIVYGSRLPLREETAIG